MADGHEMTINEAAAMTAAWRNSDYFQDFDLRKALAFNRAAIERLLSQSDCQGIRCYLALDKNQLITLVLAGYDSGGNDIMRELAERGNPCPDFCGNADELNS